MAYLTTLLMASCLVTIGLTCDSSDPTYYTNNVLTCSNMSPKLTQVPDMPSGIKTLRVDTNAITLDSVDCGKFTDRTTITQLHIKSNLITSIPGSCVSQLTKLTGLYLSNNQIDTIADNAFSNMKALKTADLSKNKLTSFKRFFEDSSALMRIKLAWNNIESLASDSFVGLPKLQELQLQHNPIGIFPSDIFNNLNSLQVLRISGTANETDSLTPGMFKDLSALKELGVMKNKLTEFPLSLIESVPRSKDQPLNLAMGLNDFDCCAGLTGVWHETYTDTLKTIKFDPNGKLGKKNLEPVCVGNTHTFATLSSTCDVGTPPPQPPDPLPPPSGDSSFRFLNIYDSKMVLQQAPAEPMIGGFAKEEDQTVTLKLYRDGSPAVLLDTQTTTTGLSELNQITWWFNLRPITGGYDSYTIQAIYEPTGEIKTLTDVLFGDVLFCSGQSNMAMNLYECEDFDDINNANTYEDKIRLYRVENFGVRSDTPQHDAGVNKNSRFHPWHKPDDGTDPENVKKFSALCWHLAAHLANHVEVPIGAIHAAVPGSPIRRWAPIEITVDNYPEVEDRDNEYFNAYIYPWSSYNLKLFIWYQGEGDIPLGRRVHYKQVFPASINYWRDLWNSHTNEVRIGPDGEPWKFPFGFVSLAPNKDPSDPRFDYKKGTPDMRPIQMCDYKTVPNECLENCFIANAMPFHDFDSPKGSLHPRRKKKIADLMFLGALAMVYDDHSKGPFQAPWVETIDVSYSDRRLKLNFDDHIKYVDDTAVAFEVCCGDCTQADPWVKADIIYPPLGSTDDNIILEIPNVRSVYNNDGSFKRDVYCFLPNNSQGKPVTFEGVRYAWRQTPCPGDNCAIYGKRDPRNDIADIPMLTFQEYRATFAEVTSIPVPSP